MTILFRVLSEFPVKANGHFLGLGSANPRGCVWTTLERRHRIQVRDTDRYYDVIRVDTRGTISFTEHGLSLLQSGRLLLKFPPDKRWDELADFEDELSKPD